MSVLSLNPESGVNHRPPAPTDDELIRAVAFGPDNENASKMLHDRHYARVLNFLRGRCRDQQHAEDVCQETFLKVFRNADGYQPRDGAFVAWLFTIARRALIDSSKKPHREPVGEIDEEMTPARPEASDASPREKQIVALRVLVALDELDAPRREIVILRFFSRQLASCWDRRVIREFRRLDTKKLPSRALAEQIWRALAYPEEWVPVTEVSRTTSLSYWQCYHPCRAFLVGLYHHWKEND